MLGIENEIRNSMPQRLHSVKCCESKLLGDFTYSRRLGRIPSGSAIEGELRGGVVGTAFQDQGTTCTKTL